MKIDPDNTVVDVYPAGVPTNWPGLACGNCGQDCAFEVVKQRDDTAQKTGLRVLALVFVCDHCDGSCSFISERIIDQDEPVMDSVLDVMPSDN